mgnify:CR=1 FL=1
MSFSCLSQKPSCELRSRARTFLRVIRSFPAIVLGGLLVASCAHEKPVAPIDPTPLDQRLGHFAAAQNAGKWEALRSYFAKDAMIQSPVTPRPVGVDAYLRALAAEPFQVTFSQTEIVYSFPGRAATRSDAVAMAPARFNLRERITVDWRLEEGSWRIARIVYPEWPAILGTWRRSGLRNEGSLELRILPGGTYVIYTAEDYSVAEFRGRYELDGNRITFTDTSSNDPKKFEAGPGSYMFLRTATGVNFRKVSDESSWRAERFDGAWIGLR